MAEQPYSQHAPPYYYSYIEPTFGKENLHYTLTEGELYLPSNGTGYKEDLSKSISNNFFAVLPEIQELFIYSSYDSIPLPPNIYPENIWTQNESIRRKEILKKGFKCSTINKSLLNCTNTNSIERILTFQTSRAYRQRETLCLESSDSSGSYTPEQVNTPTESPGTLFYVQEPPFCVSDSRAKVQANIHQESSDAGTGDCAATGRTRRQSLERTTKLKIGNEYAKCIPQLNNTSNEDLMPTFMTFPILPAVLPPARQTARSRTASESSGSHSPTQANTQPQSTGSGFDDCAATGRSRKQSFKREHILNKSLEYQLPPDISPQKVHGWSVKTNTNQNTRVYTFPDYKNKDKRQINFEIFKSPVLEPSAELLAENGMFYDGVCTEQDGTVVTDMVYCYKCGRTLSRFEAQDDPQMEHRICNPIYCVHAEYHSKEARLASFETLKWPLLVPTPEDLADNDMFYLGPYLYNGTVETDLVHCYKCGGILCRFEPNDDPREEHRKGNPDCLNTDWRKN